MLPPSGCFSKEKQEEEKEKKKRREEDTTPQLTNERYKQWGEKEV